MPAWIARGMNPQVRAVATETAPLNASQNREAIAWKQGQ
ncbi:hypothetical protein BH18ACT17_BH18ACT17_16030 [soil metagenome]